jgi:class 3 adenylate cyclase
MAGPYDKTIQNEAESPADGGVAVLFADIAGSTRLYDALGDTDAKTMIDEALTAMRVITQRHGGRIIKTIGDELMCLFPRRGSRRTDMQTLSAGGHKASSA